MPPWWRAIEEQFKGQRRLPHKHFKPTDRFEPARPRRPQQGRFKRGIDNVIDNGIGGERR